MTKHTPPTEQGEKGTAESRYLQLKPLRDVYLTRARECCKYTIPGLLKEHEGPTQTQKLKTPWQSLGARGVKNLASKFLLLFFPAGNPFFKLQPESAVMDQLPTNEEGKAQKTEIEEGLAKVEKSAMNDIESSPDRVAVDEALKHLIVGGNVLAKEQDEGMRVFHLDRYVAVRDPSGNLLEVVVMESVAPAALDSETLDIIQSTTKYKAELARDRDSVERTLDLFTHIKLENGTWTEYQECFGMQLPGSEGTYPKDKCPWFALRFSRIDGEDYGRGYVEELLGDLKSLETSMQALVEGALAAARVVGMVAPNGTVNIKTLNEAANGQFIEGNADDVTFLQLQKFADFSITFKVVEMLSERVSHAFLLNSSIQRNAERVTAEEIRYMASELDDALGGAYAILAQEFQLPYIKVRLNRLTREGRIVALPKEIVKPIIVTGLEALGRGHERNKLLQFVSDLTNTVGPETTAKVLVLTELAARLAVSIGIDTNSLIKDPEQLAQEDQLSMLQALIQQLGPEAIKQMGGMAQTNMQAGGVAPTGEGDTVNG